tara:strand:+ start:487 stop:630 length:144 start_codon:yes stop_codon:yes gene_type:complete
MTDQFNRLLMKEINEHKASIERLENKLDKVLGAFEILLTSVPKKKND